MHGILKSVPEETTESALNTSEASEEGGSTSACKDRRYYVFQELLGTEENYVEVLQCLVTNYKNQLDALEDDERKKIFSDHEMHVLFSRFARLLETHKNILGYLRRENAGWTGKNLIGHVFAHQKENLLKDYVPYLNNYDEILDILKSIEDNPAADQFIKSREAKSSKKFSLKDLLVRPVQRLPSTKMLLKELLKATSKKKDDYKCIEIAIGVIEDVLLKSNDNRRKTDHLQQTLEVFNSIEGLPTEMYNSARSFQCQADFQILHAGTPYLKTQRRSIITLFLFNDLVLATKRRDQISSVCSAKSERRLTVNPSNTSTASVTNLSKALSRTSSLSMLKRSFSFISGGIKKERKPFKLVVELSFINFRQFMCIKQDGLYFLKLRDEMSDEWNTLKVACETTNEIAAKFFETLCDLMKSTSGRDVSLIDTSSLGHSSVPVEGLDAHDLKYLHKNRLSFRSHKSKLYETYSSLDHC